MRYEAGDCTTVIASKELSNDVLKVIFDAGHIFPKIALKPEAIYNPWFFVILGQNTTFSKTDII